MHMITLPGNRFTSFDNHFAKFMCRLSAVQDPELFLAAALVNEALRNGHVCIDLNKADEYNRMYSQSEQIQLPSTDMWIKILKKSAVVGKPGDYRPLILDSDKLYLYRYWNYEQQLAKMLLKRTTTKPSIDIKSEAENFASLYPHQQELNWQKVAATAALINSFTCICGGPGTGKTTTVAKMLLLLQQFSSKNLRIALCAPTGKAAARLHQSIISTVSQVNADPFLVKKLPSETFTIHRLLVPIPASPYFQFNSKNVLPFDIVLVDETSMVDLALMTKLVMAVPEKSRLIFIGDKNQLSSVEAGAVLGDICDTGTEHNFTVEQCKNIRRLIPEFTDPGNETEPPISNSIVTLKKSFRFSDNSIIGSLSRAIKNGHSSEVKKILQTPSQNECVWKLLPAPITLRDHLNQAVRTYYAKLPYQRDAHDALRLLEQFRILCAARQGPYGMESINRLIISLLCSMGIISPGESLFKGLPLMVTGNDYLLDIYNGDTGIIFTSANKSEGFKALFSASDGTLRQFIPRQIASWETAYAMTVHKSQGSEFDHILLILPPVFNPVLTRELLYTAITRARKKVEIWCTEAILERTIRSKTIRDSGLRDLLWDVKRT